MRREYSLIAAPIITEKGTFVNETGNQVVFQVRPDANKIEISKAVEKLFKVKVVKVRTANMLGKTRRVGRSLGKSLRLEEGVRDPRRGPAHRLLRAGVSACRRSSTNPRRRAADSVPAPTSPRSRATHPSRACSRRSGSRAAATTAAASPRAIVAADTSGATASSTSADQGRTCRRASRRSSTIPTARRASRSCTTPTGRSATSWRRSVSRVGDRVTAGADADIKPGNSLPLKLIPLGTMVHNVELRPGSGGQLVRSAGRGASSWPRKASTRW